MLNEMGISVLDEETAIELVLLRDVLTGNGHVNDITLSELRRNWEHQAKKVGNKWMVTMQYVGPPASIIMPPRWEILVDGRGRVIELAEVYPSISEPGLEMPDIRYR